jgi:glycosyltransferase involved in cell wall biosynthesis
MLPAGPLVILGALAAGKPVVATDVTGTRDYVQDGVSGYFAALGDTRGMADRWASLLADAGTRGRGCLRASSSPERIFAADATRFASDHAKQTHVHV